MKGGDDFFDAFSPFTPDHQAPPLDAEAVVQGRARVRSPGRCICCPACKSFAVGRDDNKKSKELVRWECHQCRHAWKESARLVAVKVWAVVTDT